MLMIVFSMGVIDSLGRILANENFFDQITGESYLKSYRSANDMNNYIDNYMKLHFNIPSSDDVENGSFIKNNLIEELSYRYAEWSGYSTDMFKIEYNKKTNKYMMQYTDMKDNTNNVSNYESFDEYYGNREPANYSLKRFFEENPNILESITIQLKNNAQYEQKKLTDWLAKEDYGIEVIKLNADDKNYLKKLEETTTQFKQYPLYYIIKNGIVESNINWFETYSYSETQYLDLNKTTILFGMTPEHLVKTEREWTAGRTELIKHISYGLGCGIGVLACFIYLCTVIGKKENDNTIILNGFDSIWTEAQLLFGGLLIIVCMGIGVKVLSEISYELAYKPFFIACNMIAAAVGSTVLGGILLSQIKRMKVHQFWDGFIGIRILKKIGRGIIVIWQSGPRMVRLVLLVILSILFSGTVVGAFLLLPFAVYFCYRYVMDFEAVLNGVEKISNGQLDYKIKTTMKGDLRDLAEKINSIPQGLDHVVSSEAQVDNIKSDLIYNATEAMQEPLSIMADYVERLKSIEDNDDTTMEYIEIIDEKTNQLKQISSDLFKASEVTTGRSDINMELINFSAYLEEALAGYQEKLEEAQLVLKVTLPDEPVNIMADRNLLNQVFQTIMGNIPKHALKNSRVYLSLEDTDQQAILSIKNVSALAISKSSEERRTNIDESVNVGVSLDIVRNLIKLQQGIFGVVTDGDLFKIIIKFPK